MSQKITCVNPNLFEIAAIYLGDATQWVRVASLNGLEDPLISGTLSIAIPERDSNAGGGIIWP